MLGMTSSIISNFLFGPVYIKHMTVNEQNFEIRITDFTCEVKGWFTVKIYENKKKFLDTPIIDFTTRDDPMDIIPKAIQNYLLEQSTYRAIIKRLENES